MTRNILRLVRPHITAIAALGCLTFGKVFTGTWDFGLAAVCGLDWTLVNLMNRAVDLREDRANRIAGADFAAAHRRGIVYGGLAALAVSLVAVHAFAPALTPWRIGVHALGLFYNWPLLPGRRRVKQLYFFKNAASASAFVVTCFAYPLAVFGVVPGGQTGALASSGWIGLGCIAGFFFLFELSYEVIYDLRDVEGDRVAGVRSYPVVHGEAGAARMVLELLAASAGLLLLAWAWGLLPWSVAVMAAAPLINLALFRRVFRTGITESFCTGLTWLGAGLLAAWNIWVRLELPGV